MKSVSNKLLMYVLQCFCIAKSSFATQAGGLGVREVDINLARATMLNVITHLQYAVKVVENDIYPNLPTYKYNVTTPSTVVYGYLVNTTGNTSTFNSWLTTTTNTNVSTYIKNPYISKLAILNYGLKIQMQFVSNKVTSVYPYTTALSSIPLLDAFLRRRIMLIPVFNITYDNKNNVKSQDKTISSWMCLSDADETLGSSSSVLAEGMLSITSIGGGILGSCQYIKAASMDTIWISI